jgi:hypothetical protein|uniref:hypothetical protein n=1 Tax=Yoonia sp. TaxID=2212373 RepID=UPI004047A16C|tara:strand:+ start:425 stop:586 length:162 start_codon:yes stop_codon:yes gene_type:complete
MNSAENLTPDTLLHLHSAALILASNAASRWVCGEIDKGKTSETDHRNNQTIQA